MILQRRLVPFSKVSATLNVLSAGSFVAIVNLNVPSAIRNYLVYEHYSLHSGSDCDNSTNKYTAHGILNSPSSAVLHIVPG